MHRCNYDNKNREHVNRMALMVMSIQCMLHVHCIWVGFATSLLEGVIDTRTAGAFVVFIIFVFVIRKIIYSLIVR